MTDKKDVYFTLINDISYESSIYIKPPENLPIELDLIGGDEVTIDNDVGRYIMDQDPDETIQGRSNDPFSRQ